MLVLLRNRIKVFYRPESIIGRIDQVSTALTFSLRNKGKDLVLTGKTQPDSMPQLPVVK